ncbi:uncharacterized protein LOC132746650 [Ruditapes philippinarum]|uniref:uncharacterized protein LOC132746650 n=1 Tax=Ruditapes philippinarum TaxID=129788 RepID=UPI00295C0679|nr:uncharacterized protein LOC132746650 [Ruditapes philippinarum]
MTAADFKLVGSGKNNEQSSNSSCIDVNLLQGFQSASGKVLHIPNKALEKAHSLLQEENFSPSSCSKQIMVTKDVRKLQENKVELELGDGLNDMEFSEWFDDEMESEGILFIKEYCQTKVTNVTDEKERGTFDEAQNNGKFVGFQTASGKCMTLSKESIKQAEQLLIDSNSDNVLDLKECLDTSTVKPILKNHLEVNVSRMCGDKLSENLQSVLQQERIDMEGQNEPNLGCNENSNAIASSASSCYKESLGKKNELPSDKDGNNFLKHPCEFRQTVQKTIEKDHTKMSVADRLKLEFENELHNQDNETNSKNIEDELNEIKRFKKSREIHLKEEKQHTINLVSRNKPPEKLCADAAMKPKGFRPFKPPKISRTADSGKYPESKRKDWNNENGNDLTSAESSNQDISKGKGRKHVTGSSDMKSTDMTMRKIGLQYSETKESILANNIDTDYFKHEREQKVFQKETNSENEANLNNSNLNTSFNDIVCMSNRNFAEMNTSHVIGSNCSDHAKIGNDATTDFDDFSQMFDDEMDFTQMEGSGHANDKKEISCVTFAEINNEKDVCETSKNSHVFHSEIDDRKLTGNKNFVGFSLASGKSISVSKIALKSAVQMMSDYEKERENTEDTAKDVHLLNIEGVQNSDSKLIEAKCEIANENEQTLLENNHLKPLIAENDVVNECPLSDEVKDNTDRLITPEGEKLNVGNNEIKLIDKDIEIVTSKCEVSKHKVISVVETLQDTCEIAEEKGNTDLSSGKTASYQGKEVLNKDGSIDKGLKNDEEFAKSDSKPEFQRFNTALDQMVEAADKTLRHTRTVVGNDEDIVNLETENYVQQRKLDEKDESDCITEYHACNKVSQNTSEACGDNANTSSAHMNEILKVRTFSQTSETDNLCACDNSTEIDGSEKAIDFQRYIHFQTASGLKINGSEKALNYAKGQLHDTDEKAKVQGVPKFDGFSTASGNKVIVSETALNNAKGQFHDTNDVVKTQSSHKFEGLSTASGNKVYVSEKALNFARGQFHDSNDEEKASNVPKFDGFSTASGNKVHVSEKALNHARGQLYTCEVDKAQNVPKFDGFSTASGNKVVVSEKALNYARGQFHDSNDEDKFQDVPKFDGFSKASGNKVHVSDKALNFARGQFHESNDEDTDKNVPKFDGFSTASGSKVHVSEKALNYAREQLHDTCEMDKVQNVPKLDGFNTASGNKVHVSEKALNYAKGQCCDINDEDEAQNMPKFDGFSTASGNKVNVSEKALNYARGQFLDTNDEDKATNVPKFDGFSTASENKVHVSEKALNYARGQFHDRNVKDINVPKFDGFSSASGNKIHVSEKALNYARGQLHDTCEMDKPQNVLKFDGFSTASGSKVNISEEALNYARSQFHDKNDEDTDKNVPNFCGFSTASGNKVLVSEKALHYAKGQFLDTKNDDKAQNVPKFDGFSTASGNKVNVSGKALDHARGKFHDTDEIDQAENVLKFDGFSTASGNKVHVSEKALNSVRGQFLDKNDEDKATNVPKFNGFSTASGNKVHLSEKALNYARGQLHDTGEMDETQDVPKFDGFSTASGNKVHISEKALNYARGQLHDTGEMDETQNVPRFDSFSSASGNRVHVSEKALNYARGQFLDTNDEEKTKNVPKFDGFSTASGNKVNVSEKALNYARGQFHDTCEMDKVQNVPKFDGFSTASGSKVNVSEKALNYARGQLHDTCEMDKVQNVPKFDVECKNGETKSYIRNAKNPDNKKMFENNERQSELIRLDSDLVQGILKSESTGKDDSEMSVKCGLDDDLEEVFGMALKRRKLNLNTERKVLQKLADEGPLGRRKPGRNSNEVSVASTDKRHPGFRPFKPVFCKITDSKTDRKDAGPGSAKHEGTTFSSSDSKSSFQTPYRNKSEKNNLPPSTTDKAHRSIPKSDSGFGIGAGDGNHHGSSTVNTLEISSSGDCRNTSIMHPSERTDKLKEPIPTADFVSIATTVKDDKQIIEPCKNDTALQGNSESCQEISSEENVTCNTLDAKSKNVKKLETVLVKNSLDCDLSESGQKGEQSEFDSFSQDEDDVYYCTLVEARRHQEEIIKQRAIGRVHPVAGKLWRMKQTENKIKLTDVIDELNQVLDRPAIVKSAYAANYKFSMELYYGKNTAHAKIGDGAYIVPDDAGYLGKHEFYRGFLTIEGVDAKLISESWVFNHYRWIIWKLAAYEKHHLSLTPDMVMLQLKYRYDREVDQSQRSSLKKIYEKDDTPSKRLVLCVAAVRRHDLQETKTDQTKSGLNQGVHLELTDGWYGIPTQIDGPLTQLVLQGKICVGHKLCITGADLIGGEDACTPLEAPSSVMLKICRNSTRPAPWDSTLGYQRDPRPLCVPLSGLDGDGGIAGVIDVVIVRKYPTLYMEKLNGGGCVFRTRRCEDRERQEFDTRKQREMEKVYRQMEQTAEKEEKLERRRSGMTKFKRSDIENLQCGQDIYDAMETAAQPDMIQNYLSDHQLNMLYEYKRQQQEQKQADLNAKFSRAWQEKLETFPERVVTPVLKFRVAGCANRDLDLNTSTILTVWRPSPEITDLQEGHRYKIYSVNTSVSRSKYTGHSIQLTATKQTRFRRMQLNENILDSIYEPREVLWASDIKRRQPPFGELDFVGVIVRIAKSSLNDRICDMVYLADCQLGILAVRFWNGFKNFGEDLFIVGQVLCCSNLMDKSPYRYSQIPIVEVSPEFTHITNKSQTAAQRKALDRLNVASKDKTCFMEKADKAIETLSVENKNQSIPKEILKINEDFIVDFPRSKPAKHEKETGNLNDMDDIDLGNDSFEEDLKDQKTYHEVSADVDPTALHNSMKTTNSDKKECEAEVKNKLDNNEPDSAVEITATPRNDRKHLIAQRKMARLASYGSPSVLSPLSATVPRSVTKGFKPPAFKKL